MVIASPDASDVDALSRHVNLVRERDVFGRSEATRRLFDFLVDASRKGFTPREIDIAVEVFGRTQSFDVSQDASVRVYVHRLRRKLDEFYSGLGGGEAERLIIPKGEYRIEVAPSDTASASAAVEPSEIAQSVKNRRSLFVIAAAIGLLALNGLAWVVLTPTAPTDRLAAARESPLWSPIITGDRPISVVVGDYYIFGETDGSMNVKRLVREFSINSREDLYEFLMNYPELMDRYQDVELRYLPVSISYALNDVLPILNSAGQDAGRVRVMLASEMTPEIMKTNDVIYIGLLSGLGMLRDPVFAGSRYAIGDTYDEIVDKAGNTKYFSQVSDFTNGGGPSRDYGLLSTFEGPTGNRILVIAGTRDVAVRQIAEESVNAASLSTLQERIEKARSYEALYSVEAMQHLNIDAKLIDVSALDAPKIWSPALDQRFPRE